MKKKILALAATALIIGPMAVQAIPIQYEIDFGSTANDSDGGVGSFVRDDVTHLISNLAWDFGGGNTGGVNDALYPWDAPTFGGTASDFFFEVVTGEDVHPAGCGIGGTWCMVPFIADWTGLFGYPGGALQFAYGLDNGLAPNSYKLTLANGAEYWGNVSAHQTTSVDEPGTMALLSLSVFALHFARRRNKRGDQHG